MKVGVVGITGRMGREVSSLLSKEDIVGGISRNTSKEEKNNVVKNSSVMIDFSTPTASLEVSEICAEYGTPLVCGTTGFSADEFEKLKSVGEKTAVLYAGNFSIGVFAMSRLLRQCEQLLPDFDISIVDRHHNKKKDAPSGTTLFLANQLKKKPQIVSLRIGGVPGDHICGFSGDNEELTISHRAFNRKVFASGALKCAAWLVTQKKGFFSLEDYFDAQIREQK